MGCVSIEALDEDADQIAQVFGGGFGQFNPLQGEVLSSDQSAAAYHQDLHDGVAGFRVLGDGYDIFVVVLDAHDFLLVDDTLGGRDAVPVDGGQFEVEAFGRIAHPGFQLVHHGIGVAFEEVDQLADAFAIFGAALDTDTGAATQFEMVVEAGAFVVAGDGTVTVEVGEDFAH